MAHPPQSSKQGPSDGPRFPRYAQLAGGVLLLAAIIVAILPTHAGAAALSTGTVSLTGGTANNAVVSPLVSAQSVNVIVKANSTLDRQSLEAAGFPSGAVPIKFVECADPGGLSTSLPTKPTECEPQTIDSIAAARADGSLELNGFLVLALPDSALGASSATTCDMQHECVIGIFSNQNDFTKPHLFSAPFLVTGTGTGVSGTGTTSTGSSSGGSSSPNSTVPAGSTSTSGTLAYTGVSTLFFVLLGSGVILLLVGSLMRWSQRRTV